jgi:similar to spore coat protein
MNDAGLALHETLDLHEILTFKNVCVTKSATMQGLVTDQQLKSFLQQDVQKGKQQIQELQGLLSRAVKH